MVARITTDPLTTAVAEEAAEEASQESGDRIMKLIDKRLRAGDKFFWKMFGDRIWPEESKLTVNPTENGGGRKKVEERSPP